MGRSEATVPLRRGLLAFAGLILGVLTLFSSVSAQPTDLDTCRDPGCFELGGRRLVPFACSRFFTNFIGRASYYPLRCVGPITVALETFSDLDTRFPLFVEVAPLENVFEGCRDTPGSILFVVYGQSVVSAPCGTWDEAGPFDITPVVPLGSPYAIRVYSFTNLAGWSPALGCIRVTAHPVASAPVGRITWGHVKSLFR